MPLNIKAFEQAMVLRHRRHHMRKVKAAIFMWLCRGALALALLLLVALLTDLMWRGAQGFRSAQITLNIAPAAQASGLEMLREAVKKEFPETEDRLARTEFLQLLSIVSAHEVAEAAKNTKVPLRVRLVASDKVQRYMGMDEKERSAELANMHLSERQHRWLEALIKREQLQTYWNWHFLTAGDSREPELAGMGASIVGSLWTLLVCLALAFPLGVGTAVYLEEFRPRGIWVEWVEVNINNLAAVPSIIFGLLGLSVLLNLAGLPRSSSLVGGLTLAMIILPTIIIATRTALRAVPLAIRDAARALGATELQTLVHHTLPLSLPGIMTGTILGVARAIGETAPLLMIGMVAFIADVPRDALDPTTVMPVQIYLWASSPEAGFVEKTAAAIMVLLVMLTLLNALAIYWRKKFEIRW